MKLKELMKSDAQCISPDQPAQAAARMMREGNIGFLPVCDESGKVLGTITDRDITLRVVAEGKSPSTRVEQVMTREIVAGRPDDELSVAEEQMASQRKSRLMVTDDQNKLLGVISLSDLAKRGDEAVKTLRSIASREARAS